MQNKTPLYLSNIPTPVGFFDENLITDSSDVPDNIISPEDEGTARLVYDRILDQNAGRARADAKIEGMLSGKSPYNPSKLASAGLEYMSNVNWGTGEALFESIAGPYWNLLKDVEFVADIRTTLGDSYTNYEIGKIVSQEFDRALKSWNKFTPLLNLSQTNMLKYGKSTLFWADEEDWRFSVGDNFKVNYPNGTSLFVDEIDMVAFESTLDPRFVWRLINKKIGTGQWDIDALTEILYINSLSNNRTDVYGKIDCAEWVRRMRNRDLSCESEFADKIAWVWLLVREEDGKVTKIGMHPSHSTKRIPYFFDRQYNKMCDAVQIITRTQDQEYLHGVKGYGHKNFTTVEAVTRGINQIFDTVNRAGTVLIKTKPTRGKDAQAIRFNMGGVTAIGDAEFIQNPMGQNLQAMLVGLQTFQQMLLANNNIFTGPDLSANITGNRSAQEINIQATQESRLQKNSTTIYYGQLDDLFRNIIRKMLKAKETSPGYEFCKLWKEKCIARGVDKSFFAYNKDKLNQWGLPDHMTVQATRANGAGSQASALVESAMLMQIVASLPGEKGKVAAMKTRLSAIVGWDNVDRYLPSEDLLKQPTVEDNIASIENNQLEQGEQIIVSPDQNHSIHAPAHMQRMVSIIEAYNQQQYALQDIDKALQALGPHFTRHFLLLDRDPNRKEQVKELKQQWAMVANTADYIANNAQQEREAQMREMQKQQEEMAKVQAENNPKMIEIQLENQRKMLKLQSDIERNAKRDQMRFILERMKISSNETLAVERATKEMALETAKSMNKMEIALNESEMSVEGKNKEQLF